MTSTTATLHDCALALPLLGGAAYALGGPELGVGSLVAGVAALLHAGGGARVVARFVRGAASGADPAAAGALLFHQLSAVPLAALLIAAVGPLAVALGWSCLFVGIVLNAAVQLLQEHDARRLALRAPWES